jgi:hypothetical protein
MSLLEQAEQEQSYPIKVEIRIRETGELAADVDVTAVTWSLQYPDNTYVNSRSGVAASAVASQTIVLSGDDLPILDETKEKEILYFTAQATVDGNPWAMQDSFYVKNLRRIPVV